LKNCPRPYKTTKRKRAKNVRAVRFLLDARVQRPARLYTRPVHYSVSAEFRARAYQFQCAVFGRSVGVRVFSFVFSEQPIIYPAGDVKAATEQFPKPLRPSTPLHVYTRERAHVSFTRTVELFSRFQTTNVFRGRRHERTTVGSYRENNAAFVTIGSAVRVVGGLTTAIYTTHARIGPYWRFVFGIRAPPR